jgi:hypothetical protein
MLLYNNQKSFKGQSELIKRTEKELPKGGSDKIAEP